MKNLEQTTLVVDLSDVEMEQINGGESPLWPGANVGAGLPLYGRTIDGTYLITPFRVGIAIYQTTMRNGRFV